MNARELEVRCANCNAGFAIGTRVCVHCGQRLGSGVRALDEPSELHGRNPADPAEAEAADEAADGGPGGLWAKIAPGFLTLLLLGLGIVSRACGADGH
jgi:hypothetical protein